METSYRRYFVSLQQAVAAIATHCTLNDGRWSCEETDSETEPCDTPVEARNGDLGGGLFQVHSVAPPGGRLSRDMDEQWKAIATKFGLGPCELYSIEQRRDKFREAVVNVMNLASQTGWGDLEYVARILIAGERYVLPVQW